ncbi:MAG: hypothetical protein RSG22_07640 [Comamonas sp.]
MFWSRPLLPQEWALLDRYFGAPMHRDWRRMRIHLRRLGDTRRALSFNGGFLSFPGYCFEGGDPRQALRLHVPLIAGWLAHEAFHHWQRLQGVPVTRAALGLQWRYWWFGENPYLYASCASAEALLAQFQSAQVEQQAQMWQDWVAADVRLQLALGQPAADADVVADLQADCRPWRLVQDWVQRCGKTGGLQA